MPPTLRFVAAPTLLLLACGGSPRAEAPPQASAPPAPATVAPATPAILPDQGAPGHARTAWLKLLAGGCRLQAAEPYVWTSLEARVLRNAPYALRGHPFSSPELAAFFAADGAAWYRAGAPVTELPPDEQACVARLQAHEQALRADGRLPQAIEALATDDPGVFEALQFWGAHLAETPYGTPQVYEGPDGSRSWNAPTPGCPPDEECSSYAVVCEPDGACFTVAAG